MVEQGGRDQGPRLSKKKTAFSAGQRVTKGVFTLKPKKTKWVQGGRTR